MPPTNHHPPPTEQESPLRRVLPIVLKAGAGLGGIVLLGGGVALIWGDELINQQLIPWVETALENSLDRPFELGDLERFYLNGVRIGPSVLPPTDQVNSGAASEAVELTFNWPDLLFKRTFRASLTFVEPEITLVQAEDGRWIDLTLPDPEEDKTRSPIEFEVAEIRVRDGQGTIFRDGPRAAAVVEAEPISVQDLNADIDFLSPDDQGLRQILFEVNGRIGEGEFAVNGDGQPESGDYNIAVQTTELPIVGFNVFLPPSLGIVDGRLNSNVLVELRSQADNPLSAARGTARLRNGTLRVSQVPAPITNLDTTLLFREDEVVVEETSLQVGNIPLTTTGVVNLEQGYDLAIDIPAVTVAALTDLLDQDLPLELAGEFGLQGTLTGALDQPQLAGRLQNQGPVQIDQLELETLTTSFIVSSAGLVVEALRATPTAGGFLTGAGQVDFTSEVSPTFSFDLQADLPGDTLARAYGVALPNQATLGSVQAEGQISGTIQAPRATLQVQVPDATYPGGGELVFQNNTLLVNNAQFQVGQGTLDTNATLRFDRGELTAQVTTTDLPVSQFTDQLEGRLTADLTIAAPLQDLSLQTIQASGTAQLADGQLVTAPGAPALLEPGNWTTAFQWVGDGLQIEQFSAPGVEASGFIATRLGTDRPIGPLDLEVQVNRYDLSRLAQLLPETVQNRLAPAGLVSFEGQLTGPLQNLQVLGNARVNDLTLNTFAFEPQLTGPVDISLAEGGTLALRGGDDRILATLNQDLVPSQFDIRLGDTVAVGQLDNQQLTATVENVPIDAFNLAPAANLGFGPLGGTLDGTLTADLSNLDDLAFEGTATILNPTLDTLIAESLETQFTYADGRLELRDTALVFDNSRYLLTGWINLDAPTPEYYAQIDIVSGNFQDLLSTLNWTTFADIGLSRSEATEFGAADLDLTAAALPPTTFLEQLEAFGQFMVRYERQRDETEVALPPLGDLQGEFSGTITLQGEGFSADAIAVDANIQGQNWTWGTLLTCDPGASNPPSDPDPAITLESLPPSPPTSPLPSFPCNQFTLAATYNQGQFTVDPLLFESDDTRIAFVGDGSLDSLNGQLEASGVPVELVELFVDIPVAADGELALMAELDGSLRNPTVVGNLAVINPSLNNQPLESVAVDFTYDNAHFRFDGAAVVTAPATITLQGDIPYALPFMTIQPDTDQISVVLNLEDEGLELLNLVTNERLRWEAGEANITLQVGGTLADPIVVGNAAFENGVLVSTAFSQPVTDLTGSLRFNTQEVLVERLQANYGGGDVAITGRLPIQQPSPSVAASEQAPGDGLAVAINQVDIDYDGVVEAELDGEIFVASALLSPTITGTVQVGNGVMRPNDLLRQFESLPNSDLEIPAGEEADLLVEEPLPDYIEAYRAERNGFDLPDPAQTGLDGPLSRVALNNLQLVLTDDLVIVGQPFYYITASGDLLVNGTFSDLQPSGVITLNSGWINLFSTQFRLVSNQTNTATFFPGQGLNPFLNVSMRARLQETNITQVANINPFISAEIADTNATSNFFGEVEFVTIFATAYGYVSELQNRETPSLAGDLITLSSRPSRSQDELLALLGSSVVTNIYSASLTQLAGFAGSGALAGIGDRIADTVGLRSFSIFPTTDLATETQAGIGIGVEAVFDIGESISVDVLEIIDNGNPPRVGLSYRLSNQLRARGTTNFSGDETFSIEYELRF